MIGIRRFQGVLTKAVTEIGGYRITFVSAAGLFSLALAAVLFLANTERAAIADSR
ncbi:hypothetical protein ACS8Y6_05465 [Salinisphaera sp. RV14]|uniref:hypothetical protein n=1 Tax=Salinisphaera sp. RV14 TaxID=3454140 RepID=UPI003F83D175